MRINSFFVCVFVVACFFEGEALRAQNSLPYDFTPTRFSTKSISYIWEDDEPVGWVQLYGKNGVRWRNIPDDLIRSLNEITATGQAINSITFTHDTGWVVVGERTTKWNLCACFDDLADEYNQLISAKQHVKSVAVSSTGGQCIIWGKNGYHYRNIPEDMAEFLQELVRKGYSIQRVSFGRDPNGWIVFFGNNGYRYRNLFPDEAIAFTNSASSTQAAPTGY